MSKWIGNINELISIHNNISTTPMALLAYESNIGPTIFRQVLEYLQKYLLKLTTELNTFLEEVDTLIALGAMESKDLQSRYIQKFKCPNIEKENEVTHSNPSVGAVAREVNAQIIIPEAYICPITREIMVDPVVTADGNTYERSAIQRWFSLGHITNPITLLPLENTNIIPNTTLKIMINQFRQKHPGLH
jgi:hypothetical protein